ncbi:MAG: AraC family transcriptional regulator [Ruminococcaceae bacterium]|nr:AraC family transcriptional regulator [Oscillospiraceae bacterium]
MVEKVRLIREFSALFPCAEFHLMPNSEEGVRSYLRDVLSPRLGADLSNHPAVPHIRTLDSEHIYEFGPFPGIIALIYVCKTTGQILFVGPVTTESYTSNHLIAYLQQQNVPQKTIQQFLETASHLPSVTVYNLYCFTDLLLRHICDIHLPIPVVKAEQTFPVNPTELLADSQPIKNVSMIRQVEDRYEISSLLTEAVKLGNLSLALQALRHSGEHYDSFNRSQNPLRNMQNQCIILNTQLRHSLEGSGIHPYDLDQLSNNIGMQIERLNTPSMVTPFTTYIIEQYCHLVQEQSYRSLSNLSHQAVIYIKNNLNGNLTVKETAKELSVHPDYLSHQFSKEMGMTFIAFLNRERCAQAANLLKHTSLQIKQISAIVGFNTISYFTKQFTQFYGKTPRDYRNERIFRNQKHTNGQKENRL